MSKISGKPIYQSFIGRLPTVVCEQIIAQGDELEKTQATIMKQDGQFGASLDRRKTQVSFWDKWHWINGIMSHYIAMSNREHWQFDVVISEGVQYAVYDKEAFYGWHTDTYSKPISHSETGNVPMNRLVSAVLNLSPADDYSGGELMFRDIAGQVHQHPEFKTQGSIVVFPSELEHQVTPVTSGVRKSCVSWILGHEVEE